MKVTFKHKEFSKAIKAKRNGIGLRQLKISDVSHSTISRLENGKTPDLLVYAKVCQWLGQPLETFYKIN
jgi:transcriptional regulator with XRE-family HTH domain